MYTPINPFYYIQVGFEGVRIIQACFRDETIHHTKYLILDSSSAKNSDYICRLLSIDRIGLYVKLKDWMSNSIDPDGKAHFKSSRLDLHCLQKPAIIAYGSERVKVPSKIVADDRHSYCFNYYFQRR